MSQLLSSLAGTSLCLHSHCAYMRANWLEFLVSVYVHPVYIAGCMCLFSMHLFVSSLCIYVSSLMYAFCKSAMYLYVCATVLRICHVISGSCLCVQPATQCFGIALIVFNSNRSQMRRKRRWHHLFRSLITTQGNRSPCDVITRRREYAAGSSWFSCLCA